MIAQPAAPAQAQPAISAAGAGAALPAGADALPGDLLQALFAASAPPFSQALQALNATARPGAASAPAGNAPAELLLAMYPAETLALAERLPATQPAAAAAGPPARAGKAGSAKADAAAADGATGAAADANSALLAVVLQWLQQQAGAVPRPLAAAGADGDRADGAAPGTAAVATVSAAAGLVVAATKGFDDARNRTAQTVAMTPGDPGAAPVPAGTVPPPAVPLAAALHLPELLADRQAADPHDTGANRARLELPGTDANAASSGMDLAAALRAATAASPSPPEHSIAVPVHDRHWPQALAAQVLIMSNDKIQAATLRLSPEHLGPVEVRIDVQDAHVNVSFSAAHGETRTALEQALPQLRAVLAGAGLTLGQATVQQQARREPQHPGGTERTGTDALEQPEALAAVVQRLGMVDEYV